MLIFLYGDDTFRSGEKLRSLKENFLNKSTSENASSSVFDFEEDIDFEKIRSAVIMDGLFSSKKIVIIKNIISSSNNETRKEMMELIIKNKLSKDILLVFWEKGNPKKGNAFFKFLLEKADNHDFPKLSGTTLINWVKSEFEKRGAKIEGPALNLLINFVGDSSLQMIGEIEKLSIFSEGTIIKEEDVNMIVKSKIESNIFETIEAMASKNKKMALELLHKQLERGDDPFYILSMYVYQFRNLIKIGSFYFDGISDKNIISQKTKLHPFVVQKGLQQLRNFSFGGIKDIYKRLGDMDRKLKSGKISAEYALEMLVVSI